MTTSANENFAVGLKQLGSLKGVKWDEEFGSTAPIVPSTPDAAVQDTVDPELDISTKSTEGRLFADEINPPAGSEPQPPSLEASGLMKDSSSEVSKYGSNGSSSSSSSRPACTEEKPPSWEPDNAASMEVARWVLSPGISDDIHYTLYVCKNGEVVGNDIPRIASCLRRAVQHIYEVPDDSHIGFPYGAMGRKVQKHCDGPIYLYPRGAMGLKYATDWDVPQDFYVPNGVKSARPTGPECRAFYPRPSRLNQVTCVDNEESTETGNVSAVDEDDGHFYGSSGDAPSWPRSHHETSISEHHVDDRLIIEITGLTLAHLSGQAEFGRTGELVQVDASKVQESVGVVGAVMYAIGVVCRKSWQLMSRLFLGDSEICNIE